jgi:hypothetical protein
MSLIPKGKWVEIEQTILTPAERAPQVPDDTRATPYLLHVSGFLQNEAVMGEDATVLTLIGRRLSGRLVNANPAYTHSFGTTVEELLLIGKEEVVR